MSYYREEIVAAICERLAAGEALQAICRDPGMPSAALVIKWTREKPEFGERYAHAREAQAETFADQLVTIADDAARDMLPGGEDEPARVDHEHINRARLRVDTRKWVISKILRDKYGDKVSAELTGKDGGPIKTETTLLEDARAVAFMLALAQDKASGDAE